MGILVLMGAVLAASRVAFTHRAPAEDFWLLYDDIPDAVLGGVLEMFPCGWASPCCTWWPFFFCGVFVALWHNAAQAGGQKALAP